MNNFKHQILNAVLSVVVCAGIPALVLAQNNPSATSTLVATPTPLPIKKHKTLSVHKRSKKKPHPKPTAAPSSTSTPAFTLTPTPTPTIGKPPTLTPTPNHTTNPLPTPKVPSITTIPNPAYGDKVIFRVIAKGQAKTHVVIYDHFFNKVAELSGEGDHLFDILWSLKSVQQGLYYYQAEITDDKGAPQMIPMQTFAVMKEDLPNP